MSLACNFQSILMPLTASKFLGHPCGWWHERHRSFYLTIVFCGICISCCCLLIMDPKIKFIIPVKKKKCIVGNEELRIEQKYEITILSSIHAHFPLDYYLQSSGYNPCLIIQKEQNNEREKEKGF